MPFQNWCNLLKFCLKNKNLHSCLAQHICASELLGEHRDPKAQDKQHAELSTLPWLSCSPPESDHENPAMSFENRETKGFMAGCGRNLKLNYTKTATLHRHHHHHHHIMLHIAFDACKSSVMLFVSSMLLLHVDRMHRDEGRPVTHLKAPQFWKALILHWTGKGVTGW